jgi:hypothetical protein
VQSATSWKAQNALTILPVLASVQRAEHGRVHHAIEAALALARVRGDQRLRRFVKSQARLSISPVQLTDRSAPLRSSRRGERRERSQTARAPTDG